MSAKIVFLRRTVKERELFGGEVYIDIDGKNVGSLPSTDYIIELEAGNHRIKMYKSHTYDTFIGFAETEIQIEDGKDLLVKYAPPMVITQPGNIIVSDFNSSSQIESVIAERNQSILRDEEADKEKIRQQDETHNKSVMIWVIVIIIIVISYFIQMASIYN